jgi:DNA-binding response OmpR family regulator
MKDRVCVVDHDLTSRGFLRECLEEEGLEVALLNNGFEIERFLNGSSPRIIILNVDSPGVRDRNLIQQLQKEGRSRILLVVSERGEPFLKDAMDLGVYGCIHKPFNLQEVCTLIRHLVR